ncbi:MAG: zinc-binding dehydrogenase [Candidatus Caldarchaeum sp.]|uniref:Enoyl reductase (ER) domain-containing protein n=1 Tax=Caldiarchaeum subterraneum TaxID=311458 RepID=A0A7C4HZ39_CALS0|nr:zinc-binding dehydrogenase [Candidatus Caldarchaeales archaeon]
MRAAVLRGVLDVAVEDVPVPECVSDSVLIRVKACGVCPVDVRVYTGENVWVSLPSVGVSGHEVAGVVEKVGENVSALKPGDRVAGTLSKPCGTCRYCLRGYENLCINPHKPKVFGFAEYVVAYPGYVQRFRDMVDFEEAVFTEPLAACINCVERSGLHPGDWALVVGVGQIGLMQVQLLKLMGAMVIAVDFSEERLRLAEMLGADVVVDAADSNVVEKVRSLAGGEGVDFATVTVGEGKAVETGFRSLAKRGVLNIFASLHGEGMVDVNLNKLHFGELTLTGTYSGTRRHIYRALQLIEKGMVKVKPLITHRLPLEKLVDGFEIHRERKGVKIVVFP